MGEVIHQPNEEAFKIGIRSVYKSMMHNWALTTNVRRNMFSTLEVGEQQKGFAKQSKLTDQLRSAMGAQGKETTFLQTWLFFWNNISNSKNAQDNSISGLHAERFTFKALPCYLQIKDLR